MPPRLRREDYTVGWVCALEIELAAAMAILDEEHDPAICDPGYEDENVYCMGSIAGHNVVIACLPAGQYGTNSAATVATQLQTAFKSIRFRLMVGIGGGVPSEEADIRLGDVVVSQPHGVFPGVVQYDLGKHTSTGFMRTGSLCPPPRILLSAVNRVRANKRLGRSTLATHISKLQDYPDFRRPKAGNDVLYDEEYHHVGGSTCDKCSIQKQHSRTQRAIGAEVLTHYGTIASGNLVIKDGIERNRIKEQLGDVLCFEMEAAGLMNSFQCLVVRGICDYADSHKNSQWQAFAAGTAAAYAKELLSVMSPAEVVKARPAEDAVNDTNKRSSRSSSPEHVPHKRSRVDIPRSSEHARDEQRTYTHMEATETSTRHSERTRVALCEEQIQRCLDSLRFEQIDARQMTIKTAHAKTCRWLLKSQQYLDWLDATKIEEHHGFLWIKGKAGTGKSTLMKFALVNARKKIKSDIVLSYFFNARGEELEKSTLGTYRTLLLQLIESLPALQSIFNQLSASILSLNVDHQWTLEILKELLEHAIQNLGDSSVICFIDALDECDEEQVREMIQTFEHIGNLAVSEGIKFRVCFSSRHYPNITIHKGLGLILEGSEGHSQDVTNYVEAELKIGKSKIAQQIRSELQEKSSGIFMWVVLVVGILNKESDRGKVHTLRQKLREIPGDLHELFRDILTRDSNDRSQLVLCIQWVLFAKQPLSPMQLYHAIHARNDFQAILEWDPEDITEEVARLFILNASKGFAEVTKSKEPKVQFIHESVRDFLLKNNGLAQIWPELGRNFEGQSHEELKRCCVNYLNPQVAVQLELPDYKGIRRPEAAVLRGAAARRFALLEYAVRNVLYHADRAMGGGISQFEFLSLFRPDQWAIFHNIFEKHDVRRHTKGVSLLYLLAEFNMGNLVSVRDSIHRCMDIENQRYGCPLFAAAAMGSEAVLRAFIDSIEVSPAYSLDVAADRHCKGALQGFGKRNFVYLKTESLLLNAAELGHDTVLAVLIKTGRFHIEPTSSMTWTVLSRASRNDCALSVKLLLAAYSFMIEDDDWESPLMKAAENGSLGAMNALLESNSNVDASVIHAAIKCRQTEAVKMLLRRSSADLPAKHLDLALCEASRVGDKEVAIVLLSMGAKVNPQNDGSKDDPYFGNPLQTVLAAEDMTQADRRNFVQFLLDEGADINAKGGRHGTALQVAVLYGADIATIQLLLDKGTDVNVQGGEFGNALQAASHQGNLELVQLLLDRGADVNVQGGYYGTPLQAVSKQGNLELVQLLLDKEADINAEGGFYGSALQAASSRGDLKLVQLLLDKGADVNAEGGVLGTALRAASKTGNKATVQLLLDKNADVNAHGGKDSSAFHEASYRCDKEIIQLFLDKGADVNAQSRDYGAPLQAAAMNNQVDTVTLLVSRGADVNAKGGPYGSALGAARVKGFYKLVEKLENWVEESSNRSLGDLSPDLAILSLPVDRAAGISMHEQAAASRGATSITETMCIRNLLN